jgi:hypothetical protein
MQEAHDLHLTKHAERDLGPEFAVVSMHAYVGPNFAKCRATRYHLSDDMSDF